MRRHPRLTAVVLSLLALGAISSSAASSAASGRSDGHHGHHHARSTKVVVNTQFWEDASPVLRATGPLAGCTEMTDIAGDGIELGPDQVLFVGHKRLDCPGGFVVMSYEARFDGSVSNDTRGSWRVVYSTLPGVPAGRRPAEGVRRPLHRARGQRRLRPRRLLGHRRALTTPQMTTGPAPRGGPVLSEVLRCRSGARRSWSRGTGSSGRCPGRRSSRARRPGHDVPA